MADRIEVRCGQCGTGLQAPIALAGKRAKCRVCGNKMTVPIPPPPVDELLPLDDEPLLLEPAKPSRKRPRDEDDFEDDDRPRSRWPAKSRPIWPWFAGGVALFVIATSIIAYFAFRGKSGDSGDVTSDSLAGQWHVVSGDMQYEYSFEKDGVGLVTGIGQGQLSIRRFRYDLQTFGGKKTLILEGVENCAVSFEPDGRLSLEKSFRSSHEGLRLSDSPVVLTRGPLNETGR